MVASAASHRAGGSRLGVLVSPGGRSPSKAGSSDGRSSRQQPPEKPRRQKATRGTTNGCPPRPPRGSRRDRLYRSNGVGEAGKRRRTSGALWPPKPKEFESTTFVSESEEHPSELPSRP